MEQYDIEIPEDGSIGHADLLILNKIGKDKMREETRLKQQEKEFKKCTFKPSIIEKRSSMSNSFVEQKSSKCVELYNLHKKRLSKDVLQEPREMSSECTFMPQINRKVRKSVPMVPKDSDKQVMRMLQSRKSKDEISKFLERGYEKTKVEWSQEENRDVAPEE